MKSIIVHDGKILLLRESKEHDTNVQAGRYQLPGGRINAGEPFLNGLCREVLEETALTIHVGDPIHAGEWFPIIMGAPHHIVGMFFVSETSTDHVTLSEEHDDYQWVTSEQSEKLDIMAPDDEVVAKYFRKPSKKSTIKFGTMPGKLHYTYEDFTGTDPDIEEMFYGKGRDN